MLRFLLVAAMLCVSAFAQSAPVRQFMLKIAPARADFTLQNITDEEKLLVSEHFAYVKGLHAQGKVTFAGQAFDPKGVWGIIVVNAESLEAAQAMLNADPGVKGGFFKGEVVPFRTVLERPAAQQSAK